MTVVASSSQVTLSTGAEDGVSLKFLPEASAGRGNHPYSSGEKAGLGGRDGLNETHGPRRAQLGTPKPVSDSGSRSGSR